MFLFFIFIISSCSSNKSVYWCGDHACINKKEKESYFERTMTVEIRKLKPEKKKLSDFEKIKKRTNLEIQEELEEEFFDADKLDEKSKIKNEKELIKLAKQNEKRIIKEQKRRERLAKQNEKKEIRKEKTSDKIILNTKIEKISSSSSEFDDLVKNIIKKNIFKPYPNINDIPNSK